MAPPARALVIAGLADTSRRHPFLVVTPTGADADRLANGRNGHPEEVSQCRQGVRRC